MPGRRFEWLGFENEVHDRILIKYSDIIEVEDSAYNFVWLHLSNGERIKVLGGFEEIHHRITQGSGTWY